MPDDKNNLYLYEALELRGEYESRIVTLKKLLPENKSFRGDVFDRGDSNKYKPVEALDVNAVRENIDKLEIRQRKLNSAIQLTNFKNKLNIYREEMSIADALAYRKTVNEKIKELSGQLSEAAYIKVIYKEDRDVEIKPTLDFVDIQKKITENRLIFRELNRKLRRISFEITVDFKDEPTIFPE
ncbi:MAG: hypothetical protein ACOCQR_02095 [bacterium]